MALRYRGSMPPVSSRITLLTNLFLGAAYADDHFCKEETAYVSELLKDLLCVQELPAAVIEQIENFDRQTFDIGRCAADFLAEPPMSKRRLLELITYVTMSDGEVSAPESDYIIDLAEALLMDYDDYKDLVPEEDIERARESFAELARIPVPGSLPAPAR